MYASELSRNDGMEVIRRAAQSVPRDLPWYAVRVQTRLATVASSTLRGKGYEEFLPLYRTQRRWSDRIKNLEVQLFPGYLFCRFDANDRLLPILTTPGVIGIVGAGKTPVPVAPEEIDAVRAILRSGLASEPCPYLAIGTKVCIEAGPLAGAEGIITQADKACRLVVSVSLLQRSVSVEIDRAWARPVARSEPARFFAQAG